MTSESIEQQLEEMSQRLEALPKPEEPPPTTLQVLGQSRKEGYWQQLLVHFLSPDEAHGLGTDILEHFLDALATDSPLDFSYSRLDLDDVEVAQEVSTGQGRPDLVIWTEERWFLCIEIKVDASEGDDQTIRYVNADSFENINLNKTDIPQERHNYAYLAPERASDPVADKFVSLSWEWVAAEFQSFLADSYGEYPTRTTAQLSDFIDTIRSELTMTEYQESQQEKMELYLEYIEEIQELQEAFDQEWKALTNEWGNRLASTLSGEIVETSEVPEDYVVWKHPQRDERWIFRQTTPDWAYIFKEGWWRDLESGDPLSDRNQAGTRVGLFHRLEQHRDDAVHDKKLRFFFRNLSSNPDWFLQEFADLVTNERKEEMVQALPNKMELTGKPRMMAEGTYNIKIDNHEKFKDAYIAALNDAFVDHVVDSEKFVALIDDLYIEALEARGQNQ